VCLGERGEGEVRDAGLENQENQNDLNLNPYQKGRSQELEHEETRRKGKSPRGVRVWFEASHEIGGDNVLKNKAKAGLLK